jgi:hypothetical protein
VDEDRVATDDRDVPLGDDAQEHGSCIWHQERALPRDPTVLQESLPRFAPSARIGERDIGSDVPTRSSAGQPIVAAARP